jgi:predicted nucleic acid-binding protein
MAPKNDVRLFLDSNVILSGLISSKGPPRILLDLLSLEVPLLKGLTGRYNLDEIERNLSLRFPSLLPIYREFLPRMHLEVVGVPSYREIEPLLGRMSAKDTPVLASALMGRADYLVTGDKKDFPQALAKPMRVMNPSDFLNKVLPPLIRR